MSRPDARELTVVQEWCAAKGEHLEVVPGTNVLTIVSGEDDGEVARLRYRPAEDVWAIDGFDWAEPTTDIETLLDVVDEDPTGVFWG